jgi:transglutaminase-like putative cysteine protease
MTATIDGQHWAVGRRHAIRPLPDDIAAAVPLALFSSAVCLGFSRVFGGWQFLDNLLLLVIIGHGMSFVLRRGQIAGWISVPLVALTLVWAIGAMHYRFTYSFMLPTGETWDLLTSEIGLVREQFGSAVAPVIYGGGWDVLASIGVAATVLLADTFAFRAYARAEALVPGGVLFVFVAALGDDRDRLASTMGLIAAGVLATAMLRAYHAGRTSSIGGRRSGASLALPGALGAATVIALAAGIVGPALPGAHAEPIYDATEGGGGGNNFDNPLVDIRSRLTSRENTEMFVVQATESSYWRSAALAEFDGRTWEMPDRELVVADGPDGSALEQRRITQTLRIVGLDGSFIPAAPDPVGVTGPGGVEVKWSAQDATLVADDHTLAAGDTFTLESIAPVLDRSDLVGATTAGPGDPIYLELPDNYPDAARAAASEHTEGATSPYEAAFLLQQWFRTEFDYSLEVQSGHGSNAIEIFLRDRVGYCEQFAGTYASMLRSLGIPTRVAVGFTSGIEQTSNTYSVRGKNAHSWPEVWFDGIGWVGFEPTPGRGAPGATDYTGVDPAQDDSAPAPSADAADEPAPSVTPTTAARRDELDPVLPGGDADPGAGGGFGDETGSTSGGGLPLLPILGALAVIAIAPAVSRRIARRRTGAPAAQLTKLWRRTVRTLEDVGVAHDPSATPLEAAAAAAQTFPISARPARGLAEAVTAATYQVDGTTGLDTPGSYGHSTIRDCAGWSRQIERAVVDSISYPARIARHFTRWS